MPYNINQLVEAVKQYARDHYEEDGWDVLIECYSDLDIARAIGNCITPKGAIRATIKHFYLKQYDSHRKDIETS
jgi:hypothetical protein